MPVRTLTTTGLCGLILHATAIGAVPSRFNAPRAYVTDPFPLQVLPMDLDDDGDVDAAVLSAPVLGDPHLQLFENPGDGTLTPAGQVPLGSDTRLAAADLNGDNRQDLVQVYSPDGLTGTLLVLRRTGSFVFSSRSQPLPFPASKACIGELDGQNGPDLVVGDDLPGPRVYVLLADGQDGYTLGPSYQVEDPFRDVNGDGAPDEQAPVTLRDCACADMNGDGSRDLVVTNAIQRRMSNSGAVIYATDIVLLLNDGTGVLGPYQPLLDWGGDRLGIGDIDADADLDIVSVGAAVPGGSGIYKLLLLRNTGNAQFAEPQWFATGGGLDPVWGAVVGDVDGDGDLDAGVLLSGIASGDTSDPPADRWALLRNDGSGSFTVPEPHPTGADILDLAFADLDGANGPEALTIASNDNRLTVDYNRGGWYPTPRMISIDDPRHPAVGNEAADIAAGDFNNDGYGDLAALATLSGSLGQDPDDVVAFLPGGPLGPLAVTGWLDIGENPWRLHAEPIGGSPAADLGAVFLGDALFGEPMGVGLTFGLGSQPPALMQFAVLPDMPSDLTALEVTGDEVQDLAVLRFRTEEGFAAGISIVQVSAAGGLTYLGDLLLGSDDLLDYDSRFPEVITSDDMDGDGFEDIVAVSLNIFESWHRKVTVIRHLGELNFWLVGEFHVPGGESTDVITADLTGDDLPDVVLLTAPGSMELDETGYLWVLPNLGGGALGNAVQYVVGTNPVRAAAAQIDADSDLDLVVASDASNELTVLLNDGQGGFPVQEQYLTGGGADAVAAGDFDGDGDWDIATANDSHGLTERHASVGILFNSTILPPAAPMDFDGDRDVDLDDLGLWQQCASGPGLPRPNTAICQAADVDDDGDVDQEDFGRFQRCYGGPNEPADPSCAD
ncbi:MAG: hypothetical protein AMXMBFR13_46800 [Phycisphaerae bacterium]